MEKVLRLERRTSTEIWKGPSFCSLSIGDYIFGLRIRKKLRVVVTVLC
jgi:hypothetical protein